MPKQKLKLEPVPFTQVAKLVMEDPKLSWRAKGVYAYMYGKPEKWDFNTIRMSTDATDGRDATRRALKELEEQGYLIRKKLGNGRVRYDLFYKKPEPEKPSLDPEPEKPSDGKAVRREISPISNIVNSSNIVKESNKDLQTAVNELFDLFKKSVNPVINFGNTTQRKAAEKLIATVGKERAMAATNYAIQAQTQKHAPVISTPLQLLNKYGDLQSFYAREKTIHQRKVVKL